MAQYEDYKEKNREVFLQEQRTKGLEKEGRVGGHFDFTQKELSKRFIEREEAGDYETRTRYYFQDAGVMEAKAERYRNLADHGTDIDTHANRYSNHSANKRKKSARKAAEAFEKAANLERLYAEEQSDPLTTFFHREEIMNARLEGMKKAAEVKSRSKENEKYRVLKARLSCLAVLKEQAAELKRDARRNKDMAEALEAERARITAEIDEVEAELKRLVPSKEKQWESNIGIPDLVDSKVKEWKKINPAMDRDTAEMAMRIKEMSKEIYRPEYMDALRGLERNKLYPGYKADRGDLSRFLSFPLRRILRDSHGLPINAEEQKKAEHNEKWLKALREGNSELKNQVLLESFRHLEKLTLPSPRELKERGIGFFLKKNPGQIFELVNMGLTMDNLRKKDEFARNYEDTHPEFKAKLDAVAAFSRLFDALIQKDYLLGHQADNTDGTAYRITNISKEVLTEQYTGLVEANEEFFAEQYEAVYGQQEVRREVLEYMDEKEQEAIKLFSKHYPDAYDKNMRKRINDSVGTELGKKVMKNQTPEELSELTGEAFQKVFGGTLPKMKKEMKGESASEKRKLQMAMRNRLEVFLNRRQHRKAKGLKTNLFSFLTYKKEWQRREERIAQVENQELDQSLLDFASDWTVIGKESADFLEKATAGGPDLIKNQVSRIGTYLMTFDLKMFEYKSDAQFVDKLQDNYRWLKAAESFKAYYEAGKKQGAVKNSRILTLSTLEGRLETLEEIKKDYDARIEMMSSPYYALLSDSDLKNLSEEELLRKKHDAEGSDPELFRFLDNYIQLNTPKEGFGKGKSTEERERVLLEAPKQEEANRQSERLRKLQEQGFLPEGNMSDEEYRAFLERTLVQKADEHLGEINSAFIRSHVPPLVNSNTVGNLSRSSFHRLENWIEDQLSDEAALKEKGMTEKEITRLRELREKSYAARRVLELQYYIASEICGSWDSDTLDKPEENDKLDAAVYEQLKKVYDCYLNIGRSIELPEGQKSAEAWYSATITDMTAIFVEHGMYFTENHDGVLEKAKEKAKKDGEKQKEAGQKALIKVGGKDYALPMGLGPDVAELNGKSIDEKDRSVFEEKLNRIEELTYYGYATSIISVNAKDTEYATEFVLQRNQFVREIQQLLSEIKGLLK